MGDNTNTSVGTDKGVGRGTGGDTGDDRPARYVEQDADGNDVVVYRASSLGMCERALVGFGRGEPAAPLPEKFVKIFQEGHNWEDRILARYEDEYACEVMSRQREVELDLGVVHGARVIVRGHIDGLSVDHDNGDVILIDAKKLRESSWAKFRTQGIEMIRNYPWQMSVYWHALMAEGLGLDGWALIGGMLEGEGDEARLVDVELAEGYDAPLSLAAIRKRVARVEKWLAEGYDTREVPCDKGTYPCPFFKLHDEDPDEVFEWPDDVQGIALPLLDKLAEVNAKISELEKQVKKLKSTKKQYTQGVYGLIEEYANQGADGAKKLEGFGYTVTRVRSHYPAKMREAYDTDYLQIKRHKEAK